jgi:hypothetical protein
MVVVIVVRKCWQRVKFKKKKGSKAVLGKDFKKDTVSSI